MRAKVWSSETARPKGYAARHRDIWMCRNGVVSHEQGGAQTSASPTPSMWAPFGRPGTPNRPGASTTKAPGQPKGLCAADVTGSDWLTSRYLAVAVMGGSGGRLETVWRCLFPCIWRFEAVR
jgi:hypothetical protein